MIEYFWSHIWLHVVLHSTLCAFCCEAILCTLPNFLMIFIKSHWEVWNWTEQTLYLRFCVWNVEQRFASDSAQMCSQGEDFCQFASSIFPSTFITKINKITKNKNQSTSMFIFSSHLINELKTYWQRITWFTACHLW